MSARPAFLACLAIPALALGLMMAGCQTAEVPEAETVLDVKLNDSLSRYDRVVVQIVDRADTNKVLATLFDGQLRLPGKGIDPYPLGSLAKQSFIVKVTAYKALGQLALNTLIFYEGGTAKPSVLHKEVPPLIPHDWLTKITPSQGALSPAFDKDSLNYTINVASGAALTFSMTPFYNGASIAFDGQSLAAGTASKAITVETEPDTVSVLVTDLSTGVASTRTYSIIVKPIEAPGIYLGSLVPSAGTLNPPFKAITQIYSLKLPPGVDTVAFVITPADARTMTMTVNDKAVLPGQRSQTFKILPGISFPIPIQVYRDGNSRFYQVTVDLAN
ncbi:MAG: hypothetical protein JWP91_3162 [Fibrobacteres bacterium]|nr:hypothetical protein [Fibrobacterota bacterium]